MNPLPLANAIASRAREGIKSSIGSRRLFLPQTDSGCNSIHSTVDAAGLTLLTIRLAAHLSGRAGRDGRIQPLANLDPATGDSGCLGHPLIAQKLQGVA